MGTWDCKMEKSLVFSHDWQGNVPAYLSATKNNIYIINFRVSPISGDLIIEVDAPFYDDPPPLERPQMTTIPHSPLPSTTSTFPSTPKSDLDAYFTSSADTGDDSYGIENESEYHGSLPGAADVQLDTFHYPGLHNFEVVEIFIASCHDSENLSENPYIEIQVGPYGHYMLVSFEREEDWETQNASIKLDRIPITHIDRTTMRWTSQIHVPSFLLPEPFCNVDEADLTVKWHVNVCAIHGIEEERQHLPILWNFSKAFDPPKWKKMAGYGKTYP